MNKKSLEEKLQEDMDWFEDDPMYRVEGYSLEISEEIVKEHENLEGITLPTTATLRDLAEIAITLDAKWEFKLKSKEDDDKHK